MISITNNIYYVSGRFFIDVATYGCGSACTYCYIKDAGEKQTLIAETYFKQSLDSIKKSSFFISGQHGSIISLCPNTEPLKSMESVKLVIYVLETFLPLGNPIQISTKEIIPTEVLEFVQNNCVHEKQVFFHISTSCITNANLVEPNASPINIRFENFIIMKSYSNLTSCIYIKPFNKNTYNDLAKYIELINIYKPDVACVGIDFKKNTILEKPCDFLYQNKNIIDKVLDSNIDNLVHFRRELEIKTLIPVFHSSTCIISRFLNMITNSNIKAAAPSLCVQCNIICYQQ